MLSLNPIVEVRVNAARPSAAGTGFSTGLILAPGGASVADADRLRLFASAEDLLTGGFTPASPAYLAAKPYFSASPAPDRLYVSLYPEDESLPDALDVVLDRADDFYGIYACETDPEKLLALAEHIAALKTRAVLFCGATGTPAEAAAPGGLLDSLRALNTSRAMSVYGADAYAPAAVLGTAMGLSRSSGEAPFALCYKQVPGMLPTPLTESQISAFRSLNANVYITRGLTRNLLENGSAASGLRFDEVLAVDRIAAALQEAALELLTENTSRLPQTDETSAVFINRFSAVLTRFASRGFLTTAPWRGARLDAQAGSVSSGTAVSLRPGDVVENGWLLWADSYDLQSDEDRLAHKAMPIHAALCLAGSVETLVINIDVTM